jgi:hypothetical protein
MNSIIACPQWVWRECRNFAEDLLERKLALHDFNDMPCNLHPVAN